MLWKFELSWPMENRRFTACLRGLNFRRNFYRGIGTVGCNPLWKETKRIDYIYSKIECINTRTRENYKNNFCRFKLQIICDWDHGTRYISKNNIYNVWLSCYLCPKSDRIFQLIFLFSLFNISLFLSQTIKQQIQLYS